MIATEKNGPTLWRKIYETLQDGFLDALGYPATFRRRLNNGNLQAKSKSLTAAG